MGVRLGGEEQGLVFGWRVALLRRAPRAPVAAWQTPAMMAVVLTAWRVRERWGQARVGRREREELGFYRGEGGRGEGGWFFMDHQWREGALEEEETDVVKFHYREEETDAWGVARASWRVALGLLGHGWLGEGARSQGRSGAQPM
jgi:hypothetical protein